MGLTLRRKEFCQADATAARAARQLERAGVVRVGLGVGSDPFAQCAALSSERRRPDPTEVVGAVAGLADPVEDRCPSGARSGQARPRPRRSLRPRASRRAGPAPTARTSRAPPAAGASAMPERRPGAIWDRRPTGCASRRSQTASASRPPGLSTRRHSRSAAAGSTVSITPQRHRIDVDARRSAGRSTRAAAA